MFERREVELFSADPEGGFNILYLPCMGDVHSVFVGPNPVYKRGLIKLRRGVGSLGGIRTDHDVLRFPQP